jgi:2-polyprenyl-6-methoxyphenol hydroxylase-like FAD-dependent oxidoreductase
MRGAVLQLHRWGVLDELREAGTPTLRTTTFDYGDEEISIPIEPRGGIDGLYAPRRTILDPLLAATAERAGAEIVHGLRLEDLTRDGTGRVDGAWLAGPGTRVRVRAEWVIGADGARSRVARRVGATLRHRARHTTASIYGYWTGLSSEAYRWYFRPGTGAGIIPTNDGMACVFVSVPPTVLARGRERGLGGLLTHALGTVDPELAAHTSRAPGGPLRAFAGTPGFIRESAGPGWALVGDAGYFRDPLTAHGISDALRDAELLARALSVGTPGALVEYESQRDRVSRGLLEVTDRIASLAWTLEEVKELHHRLSQEMKAGTRLIESWDAADSAAA